MREFVIPAFAPNQFPLDTVSILPLVPAPPEPSMNPVPPIPYRIEMCDIHLSFITAFAPQPISPGHCQHSDRTPAPPEPSIRWTSPRLMTTLVSSSTWARRQSRSYKTSTRRLLRCAFGYNSCKGCFGILHARRSYQGQANERLDIGQGEA